MALTRTWYCDNDVALADTSTTALVAKSQLFMIKALLKGENVGASGPSGNPPAGSRWTCDGSSDSATAGMDGTDRWTATFDGTKIVRASGAVAHSWIVLQSPAAMGSWRFCVDYNGSADGQVNFVASKNAFTGGSTTARPTSTTEIITPLVQIANITTGAHTANLVVDADGNWWIFMVKTGSATGFHSLWGMQNVIQPRTGDLHPVALIVDSLASGRGAGAGANLFDSWFGLFGIIMRSPNGSAAPTQGGSMGGGLVRPTANWLAQTFNNQANGLQDGFEAQMYSAYGNGLAIQNAVRGLIPDVYIVNSGRAVGDVTPASGTPERTVVGNLLIPNGGLAATL